MTPSEPSGDKGLRLHGAPHRRPQPLLGRDDQYSNRAFQLINYYIVATAIVVTAYASAINGKHYPFAAALAIAGLGLTAILAGNGLYQINTAALAEPALTETQDRIGNKLRTRSMVAIQPE